MTYYASFLNLKGKNVLLFGAGDVALRKAKILIDAKAKVNVISKTFSREFMVFAKKHKIKMTAGSTIPNLNNIWLAIAATSDSKFNRAIYQACEKEKIFVNVVDDPKHSSFIVPAIVQRGNFQIAISTGGASPALAKSIRQKLEQQFGPEYGKLMVKLKAEREKLKKMIQK